MKVLFVEDDLLLGDGVETALRREGHQVTWLTEGESVLEHVEQGQAEAVILDLGLPGIDGMEVLRRIRAAHDIPVLILTARDSLEDRIQGLDAGADDYVLKPFDVDELHARLRAISRRAGGRTQQNIRIGPLHIDHARHEVSWKERLVKLSRREYTLLHELAQHPGQVFTRPHLEKLLYGCSDEIESNALEVHIHHLRKKLDSNLIVTLRGIGYRLDDTIE
ncbi:response regulator transcription factor [Kushneria marisflavi]|uniref:DNA-binding response regulator n=1 Tax=Kushneria marisflavi TaxID=157779 RepID=A0A240UTQ8_9GAMM|nr:response regulator transcription factor [Kushneria marisflavi]ART64526.1 DNA-binding response regulator [Kushneria marisflavi]